MVVISRGKNGCKIVERFVYYPALSSGSTGSFIGFRKFVAIDRMAFKDADEFERISIHDMPELEIRECAFESCNDLKTVSVGDLNTALILDDDDDDGARGTDGSSAGDKDKVRLVKLIIQHNAFKNCSKLSDVILLIADDADVIIESGAFENCFKLRTLFIKGNDLSNVKIHQNAFSNCDKEKLMIVTKGKIGTDGNIACFARESSICYRFIEV